MTNEEKAQKFLEYIGDNLPRLKKNLKKNITYNEDIFDDVLQESILKIYNSIIKNGTEITDYERYFYITSKFTYIYRDNKRKHSDEQEVRDLFNNGEFDVCDDENDDEERFNNTLNALDKIKQNLTDEFGEMNTTVYLDYMNLKANNGTSYKVISNKYGLSVSEISRIINEIRVYISDSSEIEKIKSEYNQF